MFQCEVLVFVFSGLVLSYWLEQWSIAFFIMKISLVEASLFQKPRLTDGRKNEQKERRTDRKTDTQTDMVDRQTDRWVRVWFPKTFTTFRQDWNLEAAAPSACLYFAQVHPRCDGLHRYHAHRVHCFFPRPVWRSVEQPWNPSVRK